MTKKILINWLSVLPCISWYGLSLFLLPIFQLGLSLYNLFSTKSYKKCAVLQVHLIAATTVGNGINYLICKYITHTGYWQSEDVALLLIVFILGIIFTSFLCLLFSFISYLKNGK